MSCFKSFDSSAALKRISNVYLLSKGHRFFHASASRGEKDQRNHYEVLEIKRSSTTKEIRDAFIKLSKENHPDKNQNDPKTHEKFVRINEAYSVLSQPGPRASYDVSLPSKDGSRGPRVHIHRYPGARHPGEDYIIMETLKRARENTHKHEHYYGVPGIEKKTNNQVFMFLLIFSLFAGYLQYFLVKYANSNFQANINHRNNHYNSILKELNIHAEKRGNKYVISEILDSDANISKEVTDTTKTQ